MKRYIKNGEIKNKNQIVVYLNGKQIINPSEEQILSGGWGEYIAPTHVPTLDELKSNKIREILRYDSSISVNEFFIGGTSIWLNKATRAGLSLRFQAELATGETHTTLWNEGKSFTLELNSAIQMLYALEVYASKCYDNTQYHISIINNYITTEEELEAYDYESGYPEKLHF